MRFGACLATILLPLLAHGALARGAQDEAADFTEGLESVHEQMRSQRWKRARKMLLELLDDHEEQAYVLTRLTEIEQDLQRCSFWSDYDEPEPQDVVAGKLLSYDRKSGKIKIRYDEKSGEWPWDFVENSGLAIHPVHFAGTYTIEIQARMQDRPLGAAVSPAVYVWVDEGEWYFVVFGYERFDSDPNTVTRMPAYIDHGETAERLAEKDPSPVKFGEEYEIKVKVSAKSITSYYNGKKLVEARRKKSSYGQLGFQDCRDLERVELTGQVNTSWIEGRINARVEQAWRRFQKENDSAKQLPTWLQDIVLKGRAVDDSVPYPDPDATHDKFAKRLRKYLDTSRYEKGREYLEELGEEPTEIFRWWFSSLLHSGEYEYAKAHELCTKVIDADPEFLPALVQLGHCLNGLGRREAAINELRGAIEADPESAAGYRELAYLQMYDGDPDAALRTVGQAIGQGVYPNELEDVSTTLLRRRNGPVWRETHEYKSKHYHVRSDIDQRMCVEAATLLEESLRIYEDRIRRLPATDEKGARFDVYLFSGQAGYLAYTADLWGRPAHGTAGLYSPVLEQLLIWNLPDRAAMLRTVRHEGFHQYVDQLVEGDVPLWLNEGLAEYFETATIEGGHPVDGAPLTQHVATLREDGWYELSSFVELSTGQFYSNPSRTYGQAWAMAHWLMNGGRSARKRLDAILEASIAGEDPQAANARLFDGVEGAELLKEMQAHLSEQD